MAWGQTPLISALWVGEYLSSRPAYSTMSSGKEKKRATESFVTQKLLLHTLHDYFLNKWKNQKVTTAVRGNGPTPSRNRRQSMANALESPTKTNYKLSEQVPEKSGRQPGVRLGVLAPTYLSPLPLYCIVEVGGVPGELRPLARSKRREGASGRWLGAERGKSPPR